MTALAALSSWVLRKNEHRIWSNHDFRARWQTIVGSLSGVSVDGHRVLECVAIPLPVGIQP